MLFGCILNIINVSGKREQSKLRVLSLASVLTVEPLRGYGLSFFMIIPIPWQSADIRLKKLDIRVKPRRQVSKFHTDCHGVSRIYFLSWSIQQIFQLSHDYFYSVTLRRHPYAPLRHVRAICRLLCLHVSLERALHLVKLIHQSMIWVSFL